MSTVKDGVETLCFWGCFSAQGVGQLASLDLSNAKSLEGAEILCSSATALKTRDLFEEVGQNPSPGQELQEMFDLRHDGCGHI